MLTIEHAFLFDIILGESFGRMWHGGPLPQADEAEIPPTLLCDGGQLAALRQAARQGDARINRALEGLKSKAGPLLDLANPTVTAKPHPPEGAGPHDYCSLAKYWWPDETGAFRCRDGEVNPETFSERYDFTRLETLAESVFLLSLCAYFDADHDARWGRKAADMLRTWFLDPATRQTPHFRFSQIVPGTKRLRFQGLIDARRLIYVCESIQLLDHCRALSAGEMEEYRAWFGELVDWIENSEHGKQAALARNNIGYWIDLQRIVYARFIGDESLAESVVTKSVVPRLVQESTSDGRLDQELSRAKPHDYVAFTLMALAELDLAGVKSGLDLAELSAAEGRNFEAVFEWFNHAIESNQLQDRALALAGLLQTDLLAADAAGDARSAGTPAGHDKSAADAPRHPVDPVEPAAFGTFLDATNILFYLRGVVAIIHRKLARSEKLRRELEMEYSAQQKIVSFVRTSERNAIAGIRQMNSQVERLLREKAAQQKAFEEDLRKAKKKLGIVQKDLRSAVEWQQHSWFTKAVHRWRPPSSAKKQRPSFGRRLAASFRKRKAALLLFFRRVPPGNAQPRHLALESTSPKDSRERTPGSSVEPTDPSGAGNPKIGQGTPSSPAVALSSWQPPAPGPEDESSEVEDTFVLYRIIGNDLYPRHAEGQSITNLRFILENEPSLPACEKRWVINRIVDPSRESAVISLLEEHQHEYLRIPFVPDEYAQIAMDYEIFPEEDFLFSEKYESLGETEKSRVQMQLRRLKNNYVMNNNGARNAALLDGRDRARWILPFDGNCFFTSAAWKELRDSVGSLRHLKYFAVPMARVTDNTLLLSPDFSPPALEEPQLIFRSDAGEMFDARHPYGRRPKVELFWRLGIPGPWDKWPDHPWDLPRSETSPDAGRFGCAGWVARLDSGKHGLEQADAASFKNRGQMRATSVIVTLDQLDEALIQRRSDPSALRSYDEGLLEAAAESHASNTGSPDKLILELIARAEQALQRGPQSVTHKTTLPPSCDPHDYWHPAPYWWPDPGSPDGLPYIWKDGERVPGTKLFDDLSDRYDRSRLQRMFDDSTCLALAYRISERKDFAEHAARLVRTWFIDPTTRMNPHLRYAQVRRGHQNDEGSKSGVIETKDFYFFLDAVRILEAGAFLSSSELDSFRSWLREFQDWLVTSGLGRAEMASLNNHGVLYDLQLGAIAAYLGDHATVADVIRRAQGRVLHHFTDDGRQPHELARTDAAHYCAFNLQSWVNLADLIHRSGGDLWNFQTSGGRSIRLGLDWFLPFHQNKEWPYEQMNDFNWNRLVPLMHSRPRCWRGAEMKQVPQAHEVEACFNPHDGIKPFWALGLLDHVPSQPFIKSP